MKLFREIFQVFKTDFFERIRGYGFIAPLMLSAAVGYFVASNKIGLVFSNYVGRPNSAYLGLTLAITSSFMFTIFGFYIVRGNIRKDYDKNIGHILATTDMTKSAYILGKYLSSLLILLSMAGVQVLIAIVLGLTIYRAYEFNLFKLIYPFLLFTLPSVLVISAISILFDTIKFLRSSLGNVIFFFAFIIIVPLGSIGLNLMGFTSLEKVNEFIAFEYDAYKEIYKPGESGASLKIIDKEFNTFLWPGFEFELRDIFSRSLWLVVVSTLVALSVLSFDRFKEQKEPKKPSFNFFKKKDLPLKAKSLELKKLTLSHISNERRSSSVIKTVFQMLIGEMKIMFKGLKWWWYLGAFLLIISPIFFKDHNSASLILTVAYIWPLLLWSKMGNREFDSHTEELIFTNDRWALQLFSVWLSGICLSIAFTAVHFFYLSPRDIALKLLAAVFVPTAGLFFGILTKSSKSFEILYLVIWYVGPVNQEVLFNFLSPEKSFTILFVAIATILMLSSAFVIRRGQILKY